MREIMECRDITYLGGKICEIRYSINDNTERIEIKIKQEVIRPRISFFMAIFGSEDTEIEGKLFLVQRPLKNHPGEWQLPGGEITHDEILEVSFKNENDLVKIAKLKLCHLGLPEDVEIQIKNLLTPVILKGIEDWAFVVQVEIKDLTLAEQGIFWWNALNLETKWVSVEELEKLASNPSLLLNQGIMYRLCLYAFSQFCPVREERKKAKKRLQKLF